MQKKIKQLLTQISLKVLAVLLLFISCLLVFAYIADENVLENNKVFDEKVIAYVAAHSTPLLVQVMQIITFFGSSYFLLPAYIVLIVFFLLKKQKAYAIDIAIIAVSSTAVMFLLKEIFKRYRPLLPVGKILLSYSFPSGHSVSSFIFCSVLAYLVWMSPIKKIWKYIVALLLLLFAAVIGLSRIILNVHYATDVIAGFCFGTVWVVISFWVMRKIRNKTPVNSAVQTDNE